MSDELMNFDLPQCKAASIKVIGVGGGGGNAVNHMYELGIKDVDFIVCNTDIQDLQKSPVPIKIQLGNDLTGGRGAGSNPEVGENAAKESTAEIDKILGDDTQMVFITAGMGGGTGTGAAPIIADMAKAKGILTVGIVTIPFAFEGKTRHQYAIRGIEALSQNVDSMLIVSNETLREKYGNLKLTEAFGRADDILTIAAKGIAEIITVNGIINVDFEDVRTVMQDSGVAIMASGTGTGENRALDAIEETLDSPLLNKADIRGAHDILLNFTSGENEITMDEISIITNYIIQKAERDVNIIWGYVQDENFVDEISVTLIATGFEMESLPDFKKKEAVKVNELKTPNSQHLNSGMNYPNNQEQRNVQTANAQTEINWNNAAAAQNQEQKPIRLINPDSPFNGQQQYRAEPQTSVQNEEFNYEKIRQMDDITKFEKVPAYLRQKRENIEPTYNYIPQEQPTNNDDDYDTPSRFSIDDTTTGIHLSDNNKYLDNNVD